MNIKPIETIYNGYRFRSRLEARWAVFFDTLGVKYEYEKEGYDLDGIWYLPDFWLPKQKCWVEIKGQEPTNEEHTKCSKLMRLANPDGKQACEKRVFLFAGDIPLPSEQDSRSCLSAYRYGHSDSPSACCWGWTECPFCNMVDIALACSIEDLPCRCEEKYIRISAIDSILKDGLVRKNLDELAFSNTAVIYFWKRNAFLSWHNSPRLIDAYTSARQARFEHGR